MQKKNISILSIFWTFLKIGSFAFGGFMSLIAVVENIIVKERQWMKHETVLDGIALASLLPGPMAVNVIAYIGYQIRGWKGALASTTGVLIPAFILMLILTEVYLQYGQVATLQKLFLGFIPAVAAIICSAVWRMSKKTIKGTAEILLATFAFLILLFAPTAWHLYLTFSIVGISGLIGYYLFYRPSSSHSNSTITQDKWTMDQITTRTLLTLGLFVGILLLLPMLPFPFANDSILNMSLTFSRLSIMLFGGGYVFIPMIQDVVVNQYEWISTQAFVDCIALGQVTPGPIVISVTFIGYAVNGILGALICTIAMFGPPAVIIILLSRFLEVFKTSLKMQAIMRGIRSAVIGMILFAAVIIMRSGLDALPEVNAYTIGISALIFFLSLIALIRWKVSVLWVIPSAGLVAWILF